MNEVEKKEIEKMARLTCAYSAHIYNDCKDCCHNPCAHKYNAEALYNAGYGKVDDYKKEIIEQSHKITDLTQRNIELKQEIARLKEKTSFIITARQDGKSSQVRNYICKIEQQVIKEFCERLKLDFTPYIVRDFATNCEINPNLVIDDLLAEYGIGETK